MPTLKSTRETGGNRECTRATTDVQRRDKSEVEVTEMTTKENLPQSDHQISILNIPPILDMPFKKLKQVTGGNR